MRTNDANAENQALLCVRNLRCSHAGPFSLDVNGGECVVILGPSGSGKSVLLRMLADLDPNTGEVCLDTRHRESWPAPEWRRRVRYQAAEPVWWEACVSAHFSADDRSAMLARLPSLGLDAAMLDADITRLSTGERQRLALLRTLLQEPQVLLLDEPTSSLDQTSTQAVESLLKARLRDGIAIVMVTHSEEQAGRIGDRRLEIRNGNLIPA